MPIYPGAVYRRPPNMTTSGKRARTDGVILHVDAGDVRDLYGWWNNPGNGGNGSHFQVAKDGTVFQYADTDLVVWTSRVGSRRTVGIETQGKAAGEWTPAQLAALEALVGWLCDTYSIPKRAMRSSSDVGIGWHRLGVPKSRGASVSRTGGELWAGDHTKVCPGPDREAQIPALIKRIADQAVGVLKPGTSGSITPTPTPSEEDDMPSAKEVADEIFGRKFITPAGRETNLEQLVRWHDNGTTQIIDAIAKIPAATAQTILTAKVRRAGKGTGIGPDTSVAAVIGQFDDVAIRILDGQVSATGEVDADALIAAIDEAAAQATAKLREGAASVFDGSTFTVTKG